MSSIRTRSNEQKLCCNQRNKEPPCSYETMSAVARQDCCIRKKNLNLKNLAQIPQPCFYFDTCKKWLHGLCMDQYIKERPEFIKNEYILNKRLLCPDCLIKESQNLKDHIAVRQK